VRNRSVTLACKKTSCALTPQVIWLHLSAVCSMACFSTHRKRRLMTTRYQNKTPSVMNATGIWICPRLRFCWLHEKRTWPLAPRSSNVKRHESGNRLKPDKRNGWLMAAFRKYSAHCSPSKIVFSQAISIHDRAKGGGIQQVQTASSCTGQAFVQGEFNSTA